jgi:hypothetical protein
VGGLLVLVALKNLVLRAWDLGLLLLLLQGLLLELRHFALDYHTTASAAGSGLDLRRFEVVKRYSSLDRRGTRVSWSTHDFILGLGLWPASVTPHPWWSGPPHPPSYPVFDPEVPTAAQNPSSKYSQRT